MFFIVIFSTPSMIFGQNTRNVAPFELTFGPRIGVIALNQTSEEFSKTVSAVFPGGGYSPVMSIFGANFEQRIVLGTTQNQFIFQEVVFVTGLEQSIFLPSAAILIGYRDHSGFEFGFGPSFAIGSISMLVGLGYTFSFSGINVPVDISFRIPTAKNIAAVAITTGFNFTYEVGGDTD